MDYVVSTASLRATMYGMKPSLSRDEIKQVISGMVVPDFVARSGVKIGKWKKY